MGVEKNGLGGRHARREEVKRIVENKDGSVRKIVLKNGSTIEFNGKKDNYQSCHIGGFACLLIEDNNDIEKLINEMKARNIPNVINLGYKEKRK